MAKYIIDIPDEAIEFMGSCINVFVEPEFKIGDCKRYALRICKDDITPYTEPDLNPLVDEAVETIENEVWELADYMCRMSQTEKNRCFGFSYPSEVTTNLTYQEAKSLFEKWMENENEIHVGDEVEYPPNKAKGIVVQCHVPDVYAEVDKYAVFTGTSVEYLPIEWITKTGRVFPEVAELLEKMRGDSDEK